MKISQNRFLPARCQQTSLLGFTLAEMMIAMSLFSMVILAMVGLQIFGLKVYKLSETKLIATTGGRQLMDKIRDPIRSGNTVIVGFYTTSFRAIPDGSAQIGNALLISQLPVGSVITNNFTIFYQDQASSSLYRVTNNVTTLVTGHVTNNLCFQAEDWGGNILVNYLNNPVIRIDLGFIQWEFNGNSSGVYNLYHLQTRIARRAK